MATAFKTALKGHSEYLQSTKVKLLLPSLNKKINKMFLRTRSASDLSLFKCSLSAIHQQQSTTACRQSFCSVDLSDPTFRRCQLFSWQRTFVSSAFPWQQLSWCLIDGFALTISGLKRSWALDKGLVVCRKTLFTVHCYWQCMSKYNSPSQALKTHDKISLYKIRQAFIGPAVGKLHILHCMDHDVTLIAGFCFEQRQISVIHSVGNVIAATSRV